MRSCRDAFWQFFRSTNGAAQLGEAVLLGIVMVTALSAIHIVVGPRKERRTPEPTATQPGWPDLPAYEPAKWRPDPLRR